MKQPTAPIYSELPSEDEQNYRLQKISEIEKQLISILCNHREFYNRGCSRMVSDFVQTY